MEEEKKDELMEDELPLKVTSNTTELEKNIEPEPTLVVEQTKDKEEPSVQNEVPKYEEAPVLSEEPKYEEVEKKEARTDSYFDGSLIELIGWCILGFIITIFTVGIASPWAHCMILSYKINHTVYNGKRLKFAGTGGNLFVNRFKWFLLTIITLGIYSFWIPLKKLNWELSFTHFEDEDLIKGESYFDGKLIQLIGINILCSLLNTISLGLLYPFTKCFKFKWIAKHTIINRKRIVFNGRALSLWGHYLLWMLLTIITLGIFGLWLGIKMIKWQVKRTHLKVAGEVEEKDKLMVILIPCGIVAIILAFIFIPMLIKTITRENNLEALEEIKTYLTPTLFSEIKNSNYETDYGRSGCNSGIKIKNIQSLKGLTDKGAKGTYRLYEQREFDEGNYNMGCSYGGNNRNTTITIKYKRYTCLATFNLDNRLISNDCRYLNLDTIWKTITDSINLN